MSFKGLDLGTGIAHYSDLMAQGYKDRMELEQRDRQMSQQMQQQELNNSLAVNRGAQQGLFYDRPDMLQRYGVAPLPVIDPTSDVFQQFSQNNPQAVQPGNRLNPYDANMVNEGIQKQQQYDASLARVEAQEQGKNGRANSRPTKTSSSPDQRALLIQLQAIQRMKQTYADPRQAMLADYNLRKTGSNVQTELQKLAQHEADIMAKLSSATAAPAQAPTMNQAPQNTPAPSNEEQLWSDYLRKYPHTSNTPGNKAKVIEALKRRK